MLPNLCSFLAVLSGTLIASAPPSDSELLQGKWLVVSAAEEGKPIPAEDLKGIMLIISKDMFQLGPPGNPKLRHGTLKIDPSKNPKHMDMHLSVPKGEIGVVGVGIYDLDGDSLRICQGMGVRPTEVAAKPGTYLMTFKRVKQ